MTHKLYEWVEVEDEFVGEPIDEDDDIEVIDSVTLERLYALQDAVRELLNARKNGTQEFIWKSYHLPLEKLCGMEE